MSASQQMAACQLVYQIGRKLDDYTDEKGKLHKGFHKFFAVANDISYRQENAAREKEPTQHWQQMQAELIDSQWFRMHSSRATRVIAMFDPIYDLNPSLAEQNVKALARKVVQTKSTHAIIAQEKRVSDRNIGGR
jgi:hypothetical protein